MSQTVNSGVHCVRRIRPIGGVRALSTLCLAVASVLSTTPGNTSAPPAEAFGALPAETDAVLSPDGHWLAWVDHKEAKPHVVMFDVSARKTQRILAMPERVKLRQLVWNENDILLVSLSETHQAELATRLSDEYFLTTAYDPGGGEGRMLPMSNGHARGAEAAVFARLVRWRIAKPHTVVMASNVACHNGANCLLEVDTLTGQPQVVKVGNDHTGRWVVDRNGTPVARLDWDWTKRAFRLYALLADGGIKEILRNDDANFPQVAGLLPDDTALVLLASNGRPHQAAWALPFDGSPLRLLVADPDADIVNTYSDPYTGSIIGVHVGGAKSHIQWLDPAAEHRHDVLQRAFPGREVSVYGWTEDGTKTLAQVQTPSSPPVYYLVDFKTHRADIAAEEYPALAGVKLGELKEISYKAHDGTEIPAYLTLPPERAPGPGPLVVLVHGGPNERDYPQFNWIVEFLASRGYAVLQPQFRGSAGFGEAFQKAGYRQWGGLMQDDVTDGVRAMIDQGIADPHHICIAGASYGGYAALAGAAFTPKLYACAISVNGVSDLQALMEESAPQTVGSFRIISTAQSQWKERIGSPSDSMLRAKSPIRAVPSITAPVLIIYGSGDGVVPNEQSERMAQALSAAGKQVTVVKLAGEDHWLSRTDTRVQMLKEFETFLREHL